MFYRLVLSCLVTALFASYVFTQQPSQTPPEDQVVRISTDLIQIDVTVTDKNGKVVSGLTADDFEIFENGERQEISAFSFISRITGGAVAGDTVSTPATAQHVSPQQPRSADIRNTIAIVIDDLNLSFASVYHTRRALRKFVDEQMRPGDLVAIIRTGRGVGALQQFTSDKHLLHAAIEKLRWNPFGNSVDSLSSVSQNDTDVSERFTRESMLLEGGSPKKVTPSILHRENISDKKTSDYEVTKNVAGTERGIYTQSALGTVKYIISGMKRLPGRKAMMLFSDGITIGNDANKSGGAGVLDFLQDVVEVATRSSVVVYTFDTKGLRSMSITASDNTYEIIDGHRAQKERARTKDFKDSQDGLVYFAERTGGKALLNSNDLNRGIQRALDEQAGYYLLAYQPDSETFDASKRRFNKLDVKVRNDDLNVSHRSGFFANEAIETTPANISVERQIADALMSPFSQSDITLNINALYADDAVDGSYIRSFLHIDAKSLKFTDDADGWKKATFDVAAITFGDNGMPVESKESKYTIKTKGATYEAMLARGFVYVLVMPVKTHGIYQYRVALRDADTGKMGTASQIIEVPDLSKKKLALSSLAVEDVSIATWQNIAAGKVGNKPGQMQIASTLLYDTVLRQFKPGTVLRYGFEVYNARHERSAMPELQTQARILQNNVVVVEGNLLKVDASGQGDPQRVKISGAIMLKDVLQPGDYVLQLTVVDRVGKQTATQVFPFEIVK